MAFQFPSFGYWQPCRVRNWAIVIGCLLLGSVTYAEEESGAGAVAKIRRLQATWAWRQVIRDQAEAAKVELPRPEARPADLSPLLVRAGPAVEDVMVMAEFRVIGDRDIKELKAQFARDDQEAREIAVMKRAGIGAHTYTRGNWTAGVVTVFYIPVFAGLQMGW